MLRPKCGCRFRRTNAAMSTARGKSYRGVDCANTDTSELLATRINNTNRRIGLNIGDRVFIRGTYSDEYLVAPPTTHSLLIRRVLCVRFAGADRERRRRTTLQRM